MSRALRPRGPVVWTLLARFSSASVRCSWQWRRWLSAAP